jgi:hypothetical protein
MPFWNKKMILGNFVSKEGSINYYVKNKDKLGRK